MFRDARDWDLVHLISGPFRGAFPLSSLLLTEWLMRHGRTRYVKDETT